VLDKLTFGTCEYAKQNFQRFYSWNSTKLLIESLQFRIEVVSQRVVGAAGIIGNVTAILIHTYGWFPIFSTPFISFKSCIKGSSSMSFIPVDVVSLLKS
jgi:hypothetical protein